MKSKSNMLTQMSHFDKQSLQFHRDHLQIANEDKQRLESISEEMNTVYAMIKGQMKKENTKCCLRQAHSLLPSETDLRRNCAAAAKCDPAFNGKYNQTKIQNGISDNKP